MDELFNQLKQIVVEKLEVEESKVTMDAKLREDLGADSLDTYELLYAIDSEMGVNVPDDKAATFETVGDAYNFVKAEKG